MPSSVALWAGGFAALLSDGHAGLQRSLARINLNPLGSAAGYGVPGLPLDREATKTALGFDAVQGHHVGPPERLGGAANGHR